MSAVPQPDVVARQPQQQRAVARFEQVLAGADALLREQGLRGFSIPALAERLDYTRASIYKFFPTPYAVLNELVRRYLAQLESAITAKAARLLKKPWREVSEVIVHEAVSFYERNTTARLLVLGGPLTDDGYQALELTTHRLGELTRAFAKAQGHTLPAEPDVATLAIELGITCFRLSFFKHGRITPNYRREAVRALQDCLEPYVS